MGSAWENSELFDCVIVGAGLAGLTAALYLRRFGRSIQLIDAGKSRALSINRCYNFPGFPGGIAGEEQLAKLRLQVRLAGGCILRGEISALQMTSDGMNFMASFGHRNLKSRTVLLATGTVDEMPSLPGIEQLQSHGLLRQCPICDGPEYRGKRFAVFGVGRHAQGEADFLTHFSDRVELLSTKPAFRSGSASCELGKRLPLNAAWVRVNADGIDVGLQEGEVLQFDVAYAAVGTVPQAGLATSLGALLDHKGAVEIDAHCRTNVPGLYAAGDVTTGLNQLVVAASHGAIAATDIHNVCRTKIARQQNMNRSSTTQP